MNWLKNGKAIAVIVLLLSVSALNGQTTVLPAQQKTVIKAEIDRLEAEARAKLEKLSYRKKSTESEYSEGKETPVHSSIATLEVLRPDRLREVVDVHITYDDAVKAGLDYYHSEYVEIGNKTYYKEDKKPWKISHEKQDVSEPLPLPGKPEKDVRKDDECVYLGKQELNRAAADLYQVTTTTFIRGELVYLNVKKTWFDGKGRFVKVQDDGTNYVRKETNKRVRDYEYDVPLKIEVPVDQNGVPPGGFSNGRGTGNGIGTGSGGGMGAGSGSISKDTANIPLGPPAQIQALKIISKPRPQYTDEARKANIQGIVMLRVTFLASGKIGTISVIRGLQNGLTEKAMDAARLIQFEPQKRNGEPQSVTKLVEFPFVIY